VGVERARVSRSRVEARSGRGRCVATAGALVVLAGCVDGTLPGPSATPEPSPPSSLLQVEIDIDPDDANQLAGEGRNLLDVLGGEDCTDRLRDAPFTWFPADVTVDGELVTNVGIRKKGFIGSLSSERPSLKIKFDKYEPDQLWGEQERLTVNNSRQDPSRLRTCLAYRFFEAAGVPAPSCELAHVVANGTSLGVYTRVQDVKRRFLREHFGDDTGDLYEGTLSDFRDGWTGSFEPKTDTTDPDRTPLLPLVDALAGPDEDLEAALSDVLDLDEFARFWAAESIIGHWDGYAGNANNFFVYSLPDGLHFIPWGPDGTMVPRGGDDVPLMLNSLLPQRLYATAWGRQLYEDALHELLNDAWDPDGFVDLLSGWREAAAGDALSPGEFSDAVDELIELVEERASAYPSLLAGGLPELPLEPRPSPCQEFVGDIRLGFDTTWGTFGTPPFEAGQSTWNGEVDGAPFAFDAAAAAAGADAQGQPILASYGFRTTPERLDQVYAFVAPQDLRPGTVPLDFWGRRAYLIRSEPADAEGEFRGLVYGELTFEAAGTTPGAAIRGELSGVLVRGVAE